MLPELASRELRLLAGAMDGNWVLPSRLPQGGGCYRRCGTRDAPPSGASGGVGFAYVYEAGATHSLNRAGASTEVLESAYGLA